MPTRIPIALALAAAVASALAGCGNTRITSPDLALTVAPHGFRALTSDGIEIDGPRAWSLADGTAPLLLTSSSGPAVIALWRYSGAQTPPAGAALSAARAALIASAKAHDPALEVIRSGIVTVDGQGAVVVDAIERIDGRLRRVRSTHVYLPGSEVVLEEYAPPAQFAAVDHAVFSPVRRSLRVPAGAGA